MREIIGAERDALILEILKRIDEAKPHADAEAWERGWREALEKFRADPREESLVPAFIKSDQPVRSWGGFFKDISELGYVREIQRWLAGQFEDCSAIYEFGCGTGFNLIALAHSIRERMLWGFDSSSSAVQLVNEAGERLGLQIYGSYFDMPNPSRNIAEGVGAFTFGSMEQLGDCRPFLDWLIEQRPQVVCHVEPIAELLDPDNLVDWLSLKFHEKRGYSRGWLPYLQRHPKVKILEVTRSYFGSLMLESYARVVWRPK